VQMPRAKASVRTVPAWGEQKSLGGSAGQATPVRPVRGTGQNGAGLDRQQFGFRARTGARFGSGGRGSSVWAREFVGGQYARRSPPRAQYGDGRSRSFEMERRDGPRYFFRGFGPHQLERVGSLRVVTMVVFVEEALVGKMFRTVLTPLLSKWLGTSFTLLVLTPVLNRLFAHVLIF
jgi:hypothetical protein